MDTKAIQHVNLSTDELIQLAVSRNEGMLSANGALTVTTGRRTGRSPKDRFIVKDAITTNTVDWGSVNQPIAEESAEQLWQKADAYLKEKESFVSDLRVGADDKYYLAIKVITEMAWHQLFANDIFVKLPTSQEQPMQQWTLLNLPGLKPDPKADHTHSDGAVIIDFGHRRVLLIGMRYGGEMKKAMFTALNYLLPEQDVLPMHCAANVGKEGDAALFFGLSGTGKTTLSADPERYLIGDDEHGWDKTGIFNFEGGCYAKCIDLSLEREPVIWKAIHHGAIMENVVLDVHGYPDFSDARLTQNTRAVYPLENVAMRVKENRAKHPRSVLFLSCDMYGVLPPVALLNKEQAGYYFLNGYTAFLGSTEIGAGNKIQPTFSACFGGPFFPRKANIYADLLMRRIEQTGAQVYLVNTGWTGGAKGEGGQRFSIPTTRAVVRACLSGELTQAPTEIISDFNFRIPTRTKDVATEILNPLNAWQNPVAYESKKKLLITQFVENFKQFTVPETILQAGPKITK